MWKYLAIFFNILKNNNKKNWNNHFNFKDFLKIEVLPNLVLKVFE